MSDKKLILVIDDDPDILESIKMILSAEGYEVSTALSGEDGFKAFSDNKPDLILCDMMMESIDEGTKVANKIREVDSEIPLYLLSSIGNATAAQIDTADLGFNGVFQKPVNPDSLIASVKKVLAD